MSVFFHNLETDRLRENKSSNFGTQPKERESGNQFVVIWCPIQNRMCSFIAVDVSFCGAIDSQGADKWCSEEKMC